MKVIDIRKKYLDFFEKKGHKIYDSAPLVPNDPTLLFTVAGMVPFKPFFLGDKIPNNKKAVSAQRCIRTNDIDNIGITDRHLTFFEMLGNFSFGDYFKKEAISWGWEFVTKELNISEDKLIVSVYEEDEESYNIWKDDIGINPKRLVKLDRANNFWETGESGPCGPSSEIYYAFDGTNNFDPESDRFIEVYNLVFTQYNKENGKFVPLPKKNIDTGMGLERIACVLQGVKSVFDIDAFVPLRKSLVSLSKKRDEKSERIIIDHVKAASFLISDSVLPSNEKRGYVLRRLIRRAAKYGNELGMNISLHKLVDSLIEYYPELKKDRDHISNVIKKEEEKFAEVIDNGIKFVNEEIDKIKNKNEKHLPSNIVFKLYDTYGFPFELTKEHADKANISINKEEFDKKFEEHKKLSKSTSNFKEDVVSSNKVDEIYKKYGKSNFIGYSELESNSKVVEIFDSNDILEIVFDTTPFYAESGGQVGDIGLIEGNSFKGEVIDVQKHKDIFIHFVKPIKGTIEKEKKYLLKVNKEIRDKTKANHSATHLLHAAVKKVLGDNVSQAGSYVDSERLRLDLTIGRAISKEELAKIESLINSEILKNSSVEIVSTNMDKAKEMGALAYFEDKYGDVVRVVSISQFSTELCGGTHVAKTGDIGILKILSEKSLSSNTRRIEAITGKEVLKLLNSYEDNISKISNLLKVPKNLIINKIEKDIEEKVALKMKLGNMNSLLVKDILNKELSKKDKIRDIPFIDITLEGESDMLDKSNSKIKTISDNYILFTTSIGKDILFSISLSKNISEKVKAGNLLKNGLIKMGRNGGGRPDFAQTKLDNIKDVEKLKSILIEKIEGTL